MSEHDVELHRKYRPEVWEDVLGQPAAVKSLRNSIKRRDLHCFLFGGPSGCGKTTLARIAAFELGCTSAHSVLAVDAARNSGVEATKTLQEAAQYRPFGKATSKAIIVDECHALSKQAWQTLLMATEEPPDFVYWFFCTTELGKVPTTIKTRSASFTLKTVGDALLAKLCDEVCKLEKIKLASGVHDLLIKSASGSPRQLLVNLAQVRDCDDRREAAECLRAVLDSDGSLELCRFLLQGGSWAKAMVIYEKIAGENPEGIRIIVANYMANVIKGASSDKAAVRALEILENFSAEYNASEKAAPLLLSIGRTLLAG